MQLKPGDRVKCYRRDPPFNIGDVVRIATCSRKTESEWICTLIEDETGILLRPLFGGRRNNTWVITDYYFKKMRKSGKPRITKKELATAQSLPSYSELEDFMRLK